MLRGALCRSYVLAIAASFVACGGTCTPSTLPVCAGPALRSWPEADALFQHDPTWLGADAAYSIDLGNTRVLWLFGDTFIAKSSARSRSDAWFIRNSVAIQSGDYDPSKATATFSHRTLDGAASSFFPERGAHWFWPLLAFA